MAAFRTTSIGTFSLVLVTVALLFTDPAQAAFGSRILVQAPSPAPASNPALKSNVSKITNPPQPSLTPTLTPTPTVKPNVSQTSTTISPTPTPSSNPAPRSNVSQTNNTTLSTPTPSSNTTVRSNLSQSNTTTLPAPPPSANTTLRSNASQTSNLTISNPTPSSNTTLRSNVSQTGNTTAVNTSTTANATTGNVTTVNGTVVLSNFPANLTGNLNGIVLPNGTELAKIEQYVLNRTRPAVLSFVAMTNKTIDCIKIMDQLSLTNSTLSNHTVQLAPTRTPRVNSTIPLKPINGTSIVTPNVSVTSARNSSLTCPDGTIPVPRLTVADIARFGSLQGFLNATVQKGPPPSNTTAASFDSVNTASSTGHEYVTVDPANWLSAYTGMSTILSVWAPTVDANARSEEFSLSQLWVSAFSNNICVETVEAGWLVDPIAYGDSLPHLFIFSTQKAYNDPACYAGRKDCPAGADVFVQVSNNAHPNMALQASDVNSTSAYALYIYCDLPTGNWWVQLNNESIGYYPGTLFTKLKGSANSITLGGEIVDTSRLPNSPTPGGQHTKTQMGSGLFGTLDSANVVNTAFHAASTYYDKDGNGQVLMLGNVYSPDPNCYSGRVTTLGDDQVFYFGGPGYNSLICAT